MDIRICKLTDANTIVGVYERAGLYVRVTHAAVIRRWGTGDGQRRGLGKIAADGPTDKTIIDRVPGAIEYPALGEIMSIECTAIEAWCRVLEIPVPALEGERDG